jgi:hypothetical protein
MLKLTWIFFRRVVVAVTLFAAQRVTADANTRFNLHGGLANPMPGLSVGAAGVLDLSKGHAVGLQLSQTKAQTSPTGSVQFVRSHDVLYERSTSLFEGFHYLRGAVLGGASFVDERLSSDEQVATGRHARRKLWAGHLGVTGTMDFPVADLMWFRASVWTSRVFAEHSSIQGGIVAGIVVGGEWFGIGD